MSPRYGLFSLAFRAMAATRTDRWLAPIARGRGVILMFHHVRPWRERAFAPNRLLEITPEFLDRTLSLLREAGFDLVSLDQVPERLRARRNERPFAVLSFDDGYRDNVQHALPVLQKHRAPWTLAVTTDFAEGRGRLWWLELEEAVARLPRLTFTLDGVPLDLPCGTAAEKQQAFETVYWALRRGPENRLLAVIAALAEQAGVDTRALVADLCLSWDELKEPAREPGITIAAHTITHPMLAKHDAETAKQEMIASKRVIEERLGVAVRHLAYPVGDPTSAGPRDFALARDLGFETAVTTRPGHVFAAHSDHLHALPRVSVNGLFQTEEALRALFSGAPFLAWNKGRRVNVV
jgi:peptidoglycan/xylan/chitin deacetylase (PgdA/CDA1 family)